MKRNVADQILVVIREDPTISAERLGEKMNLSTRTVAKYMKEMKESGLIKREGSTKGGRWVITDGSSQ